MKIRKKLIPNDYKANFVIRPPFLIKSNRTVYVQVQSTGNIEQFVNKLFIEYVQSWILHKSNIKLFNLVSIHRYDSQKDRIYLPS